MMRMVLIVGGCLTALSARTAVGQVEWLLFDDPQSTSVCDIVNGADSELVVLSGTGQMMLVTRTDTVLADSFVDSENFVFFLGEPAGSVEFAEDGDGFRTLWWLALDGHVVTIDAFTAEPLVSDRFPEDFTNVPCDACELVDVAPEGVCDPVDNGDDDIVIIDIPPINFEFCGNGMAGTAMLSCCGLLGLRFTRRR